MYAFCAIAIASGSAMARWPARADIIASIGVIIATAAFDPTNYAGTGLISNAPEATIDLAGYGSLPFVFGSLVAPPLSVLVIAVLGHSVRAGGRRRACCARGAVR